MSACVTIVGGTGFIGRRLAERLAASGADVRVVSRHAPKRAFSSPRIEHIPGGIEDAETIERAVDGASAVVDLVGTTAAKREDQFYDLHREMPRRLAAAARRAGAKRFMFASAMGVTEDAPAAADRSKAAGEDAVRNAFPDSNIVRPALVYGSDDHFFSMFADIAERSPVIPLIGGGSTRFQPIHVDDAAEAMSNILEDETQSGRAFALGADEVFTLRELVEALCEALGRHPRLVPVPFGMSEVGAFLTQWLPAAPVTLDQVRLLETDKVMSEGEAGPGEVGVEPRPLRQWLADFASERRSGE